MFIKLRPDWHHCVFWQNDLRNILPSSVCSTDFFCFVFTSLFLDFYFQKEQNNQACQCESKRRRRLGLYLANPGVKTSTRCATKPTARLCLAIFPLACFASSVLLCKQFEFETRPAPFFFFFRTISLPRWEAGLNSLPNSLCNVGKMEVGGGLRLASRASCSFQVITPPPLYPRSIS